MLEQQLAVGGTYRFTFKPEFVRHGVCSGDQKCLHPGNGVFKVQQICTYVEIIQEQVNLYANFFEPLGYSQEEYEAYYKGKPEDRYTPEYTSQKVPTEYIDASGTKVSGYKFQLVETGRSVRTRHHLEEVAFGYNPIYKLIDVENPDDIVYAPEKTILGVPEVGIKEYMNMTIAIDVGFWDKPEKLDGMILNIRERLAAYGIIPQNISAFSADSRWMTTHEYDKATEDRDKNRGVIVELSEDNSSRYHGCSVIVDGEFRTLFDDYHREVPVDFDEKTQVKASTLGRVDIILDNLLFLEESSDAIFEANKQYFWREGDTDKYIKLKEGVDYAPGDLTIRFIPIKDPEYSGDKYKDFGPVYQDIFSIPMAQQALAEGVPLFTYVEADGVRVYTQYTNTTIPDDSTEVFCFAVSQHQWKKDPTGNFMPGDDPSYKLYELNYAKNNGLALIGKRFSYTSAYNTDITVDLSAEKLVQLAGDVELKRVRINNKSISARYKGRLFEYETNEPNPDSTDADPLPNIVTTHVVVIDGENPVENENATGDENRYPVGILYGTEGKSWNRCFITTGTMEKSYFKKYHDELAENQRLAQRCAALEAIVKAIPQQNS